jgi:hypothetical protein
MFHVEQLPDHLGGAAGLPVNSTRCRDSGIFAGKSQIQPFVLASMFESSDPSHKMTRPPGFSTLLDHWSSLL